MTTVVKYGSDVWPDQYAEHLGNVIDDNQIVTNKTASLLILSLSPQKIEISVSNSFSLSPGGSLQGVQAGPGSPGVRRDQAGSQEVHREGVHPVQEGDPSQEAAAWVSERDQAELRHQLGDGQLRKPGELNIWASVRLCINISLQWFAPELLGL